MKRICFIARMPDEPGALHKAAEIVRKYEGNISRIHYDHRIDPHTVFFDVDVPGEGVEAKIKEELQRIGYLQESLKPPTFLKFNIYLPNRPGALFEFLNHVTSVKANIAFLDFDEKGMHPDRLVVSLTLKHTDLVDNLLDSLKSSYRIEILEHDVTGEHLDDTVFYICFAQKIRDFVGEAEDDFLLRLLHDIDHIVQELTNLKKNARDVFRDVILTAKTLRDTTGDGFYADVQHIELEKDIGLFCFQLPCGGNIFILTTPYEMVMFDSGFGIYYQDVVKMLQTYGLGNLKRLSSIFITHADADHAGSAGLYDAPSFMHSGTKKIIQKSNRAYGSKIEGSILEEVFSKLINLFSKFMPPSDIRLFRDQQTGFRDILPIIDRFRVGPLEFEVLESLGGHLYGQVFFFCPDYGLLFTGDSLINLDSLTEDRKRFNLLAKHLMTSVNVDSEAARMEREALVRITIENDKLQKTRHNRCLVCGGHGAISVLERDILDSYGHIEHYGL